MDNKILYAVKDITTGKLVSNLTSRHKKYWQKYSDAIKALHDYQRWHDNTKTLKLVAFELKEISLEDIK